MIKSKLKITLVSNDMTQKELSEKTGIRPPTISAICTGKIKELPISAIDRICSVLNCSVADIIEYYPDEK